jgi:hypothetical protein
VLGFLVATRDGLSVSFFATGVFVVVDGWRVAGLTGVLGVFGTTGDLRVVVGARFVASCPTWASLLPTVIFEGGAGALVVVVSFFGAFCSLGFASTFGPVGAVDSFFGCGPEPGANSGLRFESSKGEPFRMFPSPWP